MVAHFKVRSDSVIGEPIACEHRKLCQILKLQIAGCLCWWPVRFDVRCTLSFTHLHLTDRLKHMPQQRFAKAFLSN